jgi:class 3 adenylate cyclase/CHASE2 domain-containing sensor protein
VKFKPAKLAPALIAAGVIAIVCLIRIFQPGVFEPLERLSYDLRVRTARHFPSTTATNLGFVFISDNSIAAINNGSLGFHYGLYWPRQIYGRVYRELAAQGAQAAAFDILFGEPRPDHPQVPVRTDDSPDLTAFLARLHPGEKPTTYEDQNQQFTLVGSDDYFAWNLKKGGTAILAAERNVLPIDLFATNAMAVADISADRDPDGILRRARAFNIYRKWHRVFRQVEADPDYGVDLRNARIEPGKIILPRSGGPEIIIPIDAETNFDLADFVGGKSRKARAFTDERVWHMGIVLAARALNLDLAHAEVDLAHGRIVLRGAGGVQRIIPVDDKGFFYINWELLATDDQLRTEPFESLLAQDQIRNGLRPGTLTNRWAGRLAVIGSNATGNDLSDRGATPLEKHAILVGEHWNVANAILTNRFVQRAPLLTELLLIIGLGIITAFLTWRLRALPALGAVTFLAVAYIAVAFAFYIQERYWLPLVAPIVGTVVMTHICLVTWRVVFEQAEQRRVKSVFSTVVSPKIMNVLLKAEKLALGGARREVTVLFADVRGFTAFTDLNQERAVAYVSENKLSGAEAEAYFDEQAREALNTVNLYLGVVADTLIQGDATLDKFIGDCVMACWGAPTATPKHAASCVRAAIAAQRAIHELNTRRAEENKKIEIENAARVSAGLAPRAQLPKLLLGTGINTGMATVGLMGSETKTGIGQGNYTVFGREVNLASRLESLSGSGRIVISETTYAHLLRDDPALAATCISLPEAHVKGIRSAVKTYEVPWRTVEIAREEIQASASEPKETQKIY